jgi:lipopolysaccharide export system permease protein
MRLLDRYITVNLVRVMVVTLVSLVMLYVMFDLADHRRDDIMKNDVSARTVAAYYGGWVTVIIVQMSPVAMLLSALYVIGLMAKNNELTAILAGGVHLRRMAAGPIIVAAVTAVAVFALSEWIMPDAVHRARVIEDTFFDQKEEVDGHRLVWTEPGRNATVQVRKYTTKSRSGLDALITETMSDGSRISTEADRIVWDETENAWILVNGVRTVYAEDGQRAEEFDSVTSQIALSPDQIEALNVPTDELSSRRLYGLLTSPATRSMVGPTRWVDFHQKLALPTLNFIIIFLAIPFAARTGRGGLAASLAVSVVLGLCYICSFSICVGLAKAQAVPAWFGVWFANAAFLGGGLWLFRRMPT